MRRALPLLRRHGPTVFGLLLLVTAIWVLQGKFRTLSVADIRAALAAMPASALWLAAGWTVFAYAVLTIYDRLGSVYAGHPVGYLRTSLASFCAYTLAHNIGFAAVSGAAVRYRFYAAWGLPPLAIAKIVAFTSLTFGLGGLTLGGVVLVVEPEVVPGLGAHVPHWLMRVLGVAMWAIVIGYVLLSRIRPHFTAFGHRIDLPGFRLACAQVALATVDVAVTAAIFYALLPPAEGLSFLRFLGIYVAAYTAGIAATLPGGIGVFDGAMLVGLAPWLGPAEVVGALLLFRLYYYIAPLFVAGALFAAFELTQRRLLPARLAAERGAAGTLEIPALAGLVGLGGTVLLFLGALPVRESTAAWVGTSAALASQFAASVVGSLLLVIAYGLSRRLRIAWFAGLALLLNGALICWLRDEEWWLVAAFLVVAGLLAAMRGAVYRTARLTAEPLSAPTLGPLAAVVICALTLALVSWGGRFGEATWWEVVLSPRVSDSLRFTVGLSALLLLVGAVRLLRPVRLAPAPWTAETRARLAALGGGGVPAADAAVFGEAGRAGLAFVRRDGVWLALGDPVGEERDAVSAIWRFRDLAERAGVEPAFWRVGPAHHRVYADIGLTVFPLDTAGGEAAGGALGAAPMGGPRWLACRAERDLPRLLAALAPPAGSATG